MTTRSRAPSGTRRRWRSLAPENPEYLPELGEQTFADVGGYYASTGDLTTESRARAASLGIKAADACERDRGRIHRHARRIVGRRHLERPVCLSRRHGVASTLTIRTRDGRRRAGPATKGADWSTIESERIAEDALASASDWRGKTALEPGKYDVVLEPTAVGMLLLAPA